MLSFGKRDYRWKILIWISLHGVHKFWNFILFSYFATETNSTPERGERWVYSAKFYSGRCRPRSSPISVYHSVYHSDRKGNLVSRAFFLACGRGPQARKKTLGARFTEKVPIWCTFYGKDRVWKRRVHLPQTSGFGQWTSGLSILLVLWTSESSENK